MVAVFLSPKEVEMVCEDGETRVYILHKVPAVAARELFTRYPIGLMQAGKDYSVSEGLMLKLMSYVKVKHDDGSTQALHTAALVDNHVTHFKDLIRLEVAMVEYNTNFLKGGGIQGLLDSAIPNILPLVSKILTPLLAQLSSKGTPPTSNSASD